MAKARWILPVALWGVLTFFSYEFLLKVEERSLFLYDALWLKDFLIKPSGILSFLSLFLTQFLHIPWLGALIWTILLTLSAELTRIIFRIPVTLSALTFIPASIFVAYNMSMGYTVYLTNLPGYFYMPLLGYLWALLTVTVLRKERKAAVLLILFLTWGFAGYYIAGFYSLAGTVATCIYISVSGDYSRTGKILPIAVTAVSLLLAPVAFAGTTTYNISNGWIIGMPEQDYGLTFTRMQLPLMLAMVCLAIAPVIKFRNVLSGKGITMAIQSAAIAVVIAVPSVFWFRDDNFKAELGMIRATELMDWDKVTDIYSKLQNRHEKDPSWQPTRVHVLLKDLALIKTGQEGERAYGFENGCKKQKTRCDVPMAFQIGKILHLNYGIPGICNRWCDEEAVLFGCNYLTYKYYAMIAILLNDNTLTEEYLDKLEKTLFYRKWAREQRKIYRDRDLLAQTAPYDMIIPLMCYDDIITSDLNGCEYFLINHFNGPMPANSTPLYDRVALYFALDSKQSALFWPRFNIYLNSNKPSRIARFYQEAAYLFCNIENDPRLETLPFNEKTRNLYKSFMQSASRIGMKSLKDARNAIPANLRHSYYFYFYYVNELEMF